MTPITPGSEFAIAAVPIGWAIATVILLALLTATLGILGYFVRDLKKDMEDKHRAIKESMDKKDKAHDIAIEKLNTGFNDFRVHRAETYVAREDFVRSIVKLEAKIDDQGSILRSVARDLNQVIGEKGD